MIAIGAIVSGVIAVAKAFATIGLAAGGIKTICNAVIKLGQALGLIKPDEKIEDLGEKVLQAEEKGIKLEAFSGKFDEYQKAFDNFKPDPKIKHDTEKCMEKGAEFVGTLIASKYPEANIADVVKYMIKKQDSGFFSAKNMEHGIADLVKSGGKAIGDILGVLTGTEKNQETFAKTIDKMASIEKSANPGMTYDAAVNKILSEYR